MERWRKAGLGLMVGVLLGLPAYGPDRPAAAPGPAPGSSIGPTKAGGTPPAAPEYLPMAQDGSGPDAGADVDAVGQALTASAWLLSYHFRLQASGDPLAQPVTLEGDYVGPDAIHARGELAGQAVEILGSGGTTWMRRGTGSWAREAPPAPVVALLVPQANVLAAWATRGTSVPAWHRQASVPEESSALWDVAGTLGAGLSNPPGGIDNGDGQPGGTITIRFDPATSYIYHVQVQLDLAPGRTAEAMAGAAGNPLEVDLTVTQHDDPAILVPTAPLDLGSPP